MPTRMRLINNTSGELKDVLQGEFANPGASARISTDLSFTDFHPSRQCRVDVPGAWL